MNHHLPTPAGTPAADRQPVILEPSGEPRQEAGVLAREFVVRAGGRQLPLALWTPASTPQSCPLVLVGHGGSQHKTHAGVLDLARHFVLGHGFAVAAIDGPVHGARRSDGKWGIEVQSEFRTMWETDPRMEQMVADWQAVIAALECFEELDLARLGWWGVSMGTAYGAPLCAKESRISAALLGMWGARLPDGELFPQTERLLHFVSQVRCEVLFQQKWDDQFFSRAGQIELFEQLGTSAKWLKTYPGAHTPVQGEQLLDGVAFLADRLLRRASAQS